MHRFFRRFSVLAAAMVLGLGVEQRLSWGRPLPEPRGLWQAVARSWRLHEDLLRMEQSVRAMHESSLATASPEANARRDEQGRLMLLDLKGQLFAALLQETPIVAATVLPHLNGGSVSELVSDRSGVWLTDESGADARSQALSIFFTGAAQIVGRHLQLLDQLTGELREAHRALGRHYRTIDSTEVWSLERDLYVERWRALWSGIETAGGSGITGERELPGHIEERARILDRWHSLVRRLLPCSALLGAPGDRSVARGVGGRRLP